MRPPGSIVRPTCISPLRKVPAVSTTHLARNVTPQRVTTPVISPFSTRISCTVSCQICRLGMFSRISLHAQMNLLRSHCARGLHMAGPLERFSIRNCMAVWSVTRPVYPPRASISRTICPLAMPPTAGLQLIWPILFISIVMRQVFEPWTAMLPCVSTPPVVTRMASYAWNWITRLCSSLDRWTRVGGLTGCIQLPRTRLCCMMYRRRKISVSIWFASISRWNRHVGTHIVTVWVSSYGRICRAVTVIRNGRTAAISTEQNWNAPPNPKPIITRNGRK